FVLHNLLDCAEHEDLRHGRGCIVTQRRCRVRPANSQTLGRSSRIIEIKTPAPYVKDTAEMPWRTRTLLNAVTLKEIERIFAITDALGISREAMVIPLRPESPGRVTMLKNGKLEV